MAFLAHPRRALVPILVATLSVCCLAGCGDGGGAQKSSHSAPSTTPAHSASPSPSPAGPTCLQFEDSFTGGYDLGEPAHTWAGRLLGSLTAADNLGSSVDAMTELTYTLDLKKACLDPAMFGDQASLIGTVVYQANRGKYAPR